MPFRLGLVGPFVVSSFGGYPVALSGLGSGEVSVRYRNGWGVLFTSALG